MKIIHLSDLHIGKSNNLEKAGILVDWILDQQDQHDSKFVIISGDLVDDGEEWQFLEARKLVERLRDAGFTVLVAPGNHDYGPDGYRESKKSQRDFQELISGVDTYPHLHLQAGVGVILLDSMAAEMKQREPWGAQGYLGKKQLQKLDLLLDELGENPAVEQIVLALHHHPFDYLFYHGLRDHADLKGVVSQPIDGKPRVNALLFGHKHLEHRFNDPEENKEELYGIDLIYASGQSVERHEDGKMVLPVIDTWDMSIQRFKVQ